MLKPTTRSKFDGRLIPKIHYYQKVFSFLCAAILLFGLHQYSNVTYFPWDAHGYWMLSDPKIFLNFPKEIRGYFYPLVLLPAHSLSKLTETYQHYPYRIYSSLAYAALLTNLVPLLYQRVFGGYISFFRRMILPVLVIILFPGLIIYPLSDLPAFLLLIGAIYLLTNLNLEVQSDIKNVLLLIASGFLAGAAYNTRTIYIFPFFCIFFIIPFYFIRNRTVCARLVALAAFTVGAFLVSLPQALINLRTQGALTPQVISQQTDKSLFALQLMWGITIQRYETTIDPAAPSPSRYFVDKAGEQLFSAKNVANLEVSIVNYISLLVENPLEFVGIFGRHVVNGLDLRDGEVYVNDVKSTRGGITIVNLLVLLSGLFVIVIRATNRCAVSIPSSLSDPQKNFTRTPASKSWFLFLFILLLPVIVIIPGAVETRFFLPVQLLIYATIAFNCSFSEIINFSNNKWRQICIVFFVLATLFLAISTNTMSSLQANINPSYRFGQ